MPKQSLGTSKKMPLENFYEGDQAFIEYSENFIEFWETFKDKVQLLELLGHDLVIARPIAYHLGENYADWLNSSVPALDNATPLDCLKTADGIKRLKTCLRRLPC
ncbi:hypothetical protein VU01_11622 [Candidatus Electrothrix marina]|uniref:Antitoxin Xre/MbcA/ParS-like toxin-binding domain-containing protein n=1 Tax=Candidatus Electrothrix marina TaxID=1859130 RepID=A0A444JDZ0_9BACT|nr:hypothetical protein VU01_11622 [Candidatus Electrothrix marina]